MAKKRHDKYDIGVIAKGLERARTSSGGFSALAFPQFALVLETSLRFSDELPESERGRVVAEGVSVAAKKGPLTGDSLVKEISQLERAYIQSAYSDFVLLTSLSFRSAPKQPKRRMFGGSVIIVSADAPRRFQSAAPGDLLESFQPQPQSYTSVAVSVTARSPREAFFVAMNRLDTLRGIWNFWLNRRVGHRISSGRPSPVNQICLGPIHTLHSKDGAMLRNDYWFEPNGPSRTLAVDLRREWGRIVKFEGVVRAALRRSQYRRDLEVAIARYARALDQTDFQSAYLRLWSLLEFLTATTSGHSYKETIKRCLYGVKDGDLNRHILEHLRDRRNDSVHSADSVEAFDDGLLYQLKRYVEGLLGFHLTTRPAFPSLTEAAAFLSLPPEPSELDKTAKLHKRAYKYRKRVLA